MSGASAVRIALLYPELLGTYGDGGNATVLARRAEWRGHTAEVLAVESGEAVPESCDLYVLGGGEDGPQVEAARELGRNGPLHHAVEAGAVLFAVCAGMQIVGNRFAAADGRMVDGLGLLDCETVKTDEPRAVGELLVDADTATLAAAAGAAPAGASSVSPAGRASTQPGQAQPGQAEPGQAEPSLTESDQPGRASASRAEPDGATNGPDRRLHLPALTGFENHGGRTRPGPDAGTLGRVRAGVGNGDGTEGVIGRRGRGRILGTYLHGPALARNPALADLLLAWAMDVDPADLPPLDDHEIDDLRAQRLRAVEAGRLDGVATRTWRDRLLRRN